MNKLCTQSHRYERHRHYFSFNFPSLVCCRVCLYIVEWGENHFCVQYKRNFTHTQLKRRKTPFRNVMGGGGQNGGEDGVWKTLKYPHVHLIKSYVCLFNLYRYILGEEMKGKVLDEVSRLLMNVHITKNAKQGCSQYKGKRIGLIHLSLWHELGACPNASVVEKDLKPQVWPLTPSPPPPPPPQKKKITGR